MIPDDIKRRIVNETSIVEVVSEYVKLEKKGNSHFGICPFHDDNHPSMSVSDGVKMFNCFSCGTKGNVIYFVSRYEHISMDQAAIKLAKRLGMTIKTEVNKDEEKRNRLYELLGEATNFYQFYLRHSDEGLKALDYLHKRGISDEIIDTFKIGLAPDGVNFLTSHLTKKNFSELDQIEVGLAKSNNKNELYDTFRARIMFPITNTQGRTVGFSGRVYYQSDQAKYINSNENFVFHKSNILYNLDNAYNEASKKKQIYIFEGFMDVIAAYRCGKGCGVATMGTALTSSHIKTLLGITNNIVLCFDGDEAGIKAMRRSAASFAEVNVVPYSVVLPNNQDPDEYIKEHGEKELNNYLTTKVKPVYEWLYILAKKKLIVSDVLSMEQFKNEVFAFLKDSKSSTIIEYYLNQMAKDLNFDFESVKRDFNKYNTIGATVEEKREVVNKTPEKKQIIKPKVRKAYQVIIKHLINDNKAASKLPNNEFINNDLAIEFSIISTVVSMLQANPSLMDDVNYAEKIQNELNKSEKFKSYLTELANNKMILTNDEQEFLDCIETLKQFFKEIEREKLKNRVLKEANQQSVERFVNSKRDN